MSKTNTISGFDATQYFQSWAFDIKKAHWAAFGIVLREYIDKERTARAREKWAENNARYKELSPIFHKKIKTVKHLPEFKEWNNLKAQRARIKITRMAYAKPKNIASSLDFHEGDIYYLKRNNSIGIQLIDEGDPLEVMLFNSSNNESSLGYHIPPNLLMKWLKTGITPESNAISANLSKSEIAKFHEYR